MDKETLILFSDFLYDRGQYEDAIKIFEQSLAAGNEGRRLRCRLARARLCLYRITIAHAHKTPPLLHDSAVAEANVASAAARFKAVPALHDDVAGPVALAAIHAAAAAADQQSSHSHSSHHCHHHRHHHHTVPLLSPKRPCPLPLSVAAERARRHLEVRFFLLVPSRQPQNSPGGLFCFVGGQDGPYSRAELRRGHKAPPTNPF